MCVGVHVELGRVALEVRAAVLPSEEVGPALEEPRDGSGSLIVRSDARTLVIGRGLTVEELVWIRDAIASQLLLGAARP